MFDVRGTIAAIGAESNNGILIGDFGTGTAPSTGTFSIGAAAGKSLVIRDETAGSERARIDNSGRLLIGTSTARTTYDGSSLTPQFQVEGTTGGTSHLALCRNAASTAGPALVLGKTRQTAAGQAIDTAVLSGDILGTIQFEGADGTDFVTAASISAVADGEFNTSGDTTDGPGRLVFSVTADGSASPTEALRISSNRAITVSDGGNVVLGTTTGTKIGTATTQKLGFYNATPVVQPTAVANATDAATAISQLNALLAHMRMLGLIAT